MKGDFIPLGLYTKVKEWRSKWVFMDTLWASELFSVPRAQARKHAGWKRRPIKGAGYSAPAGRIMALTERGLTRQMVAREFVRNRIAPL